MAAATDKTVPPITAELSQPSFYFRSLRPTGVCYVPPFFTRLPHIKTTLNSPTDLGRKRTKTCRRTNAALGWMTKGERHKGDARMTSAAPDFGTFHISTTDLPERDRLAAWREDFGRNVLRLDFEPLPDVPFHVEITLHALPALKMASTRCSPARVMRTKQLVDDGDDGFCLGLPSAGGVIASARNQELTVHAHDTVLTSWAESTTFVHPAPVRFISLFMPRAALTPLVRNVDDAVMRLIPHNVEALRLLTGYVNLLENQMPEAPELRRLAVTHVYDLVALTIGATRDAANLAAGRGVSAARLSAIKTDIIDNLARPDLSVGTVAARQGVTPRYVQALFEGEDTTFSEFVLGQRLVRAHRMLTDWRFAGWTITAIAFEAGFGDLSYFNRAFRRVYAASPSEVRSAARQEDGEREVA